MKRQMLFDLYTALSDRFGARPAWVLLELLRTSNGHEPLGPDPVTPQDVLDLYAALRSLLPAEAAWYMVESLRSGNRDRLPGGLPWPDGFPRR